MNFSLRIHETLAYLCRLMLLLTDWQFNFIICGRVIRHLISIEAKWQCHMFAL